MKPLSNTRIRYVIRKMWVYHREDGCDLELHASSKDEAVFLLREFGITNPDLDKLHESEKRDDPVQID